MRTETQRRLGIVGVVVGVVLTATACLGPTEGQQAERETARVAGNQQSIYTKGQPVPVFDYSAQRDALIQIYQATVPEMRPSWHVFSTLGVGFTDACQGVGVAIPFSTQLTSPAYIADAHTNGGFVTLPQPEPDGTYKPDDSVATWVLCDFGSGLEPVYVEDSVRTYFHEVRVENGRIIHETTEPPSILLDLGAQNGRVAASPVAP